MAHKEPIAKVLEKSGTLLTFGGYEIYGICDIDLQYFSGEPSSYDVKTVVITFTVSTADCLENNIIEGLPFTMEDDSYIYSFIVNRNPVADFTGWSSLHCDFIEKAAL